MAGPLPKVDDGWTLEAFKTLMRINSVNPDVGGGPGEAAIADAIESMLEKSGVEVESQSVKGDRRNVVGILGGRGSGKSLMLNGHMDTVGVQNMKVEPFVPKLAGGLLYGRGSCDMKGGLAAMLSAAKSIASSGRRLGGDLYLAFVVDEEFDSLGSERVAERYRADSVVVCEPTEMNVGIAHMGFVWVELETIGRAAHGSVADRGQDAIADMAAVVVEIERDQKLNKRSHPLLGSPKFHTSKVVGGQDWSIVPDYCKLSVERRTIPGESPAAILAGIRRSIARARSRSPKIRANAKLVFERPPLQTPRESGVAQAIAKAKSESGGRTKFVGLPYWSDASIFDSKARIPAVLFGPGNIRYAHSAAEFVPLDEVIKAAHVLAGAAVGFCGSSA